MGSRGVASGPRQVERGGFPRTRLVHKRTCTKGELHIEVRRLVDGEVSCLLADCVAADDDVHDRGCRSRAWPAGGPR